MFPLNPFVPVFTGMAVSLSHSSRPASKLPFSSL